jgi:hypothetical protein
MYEFRRGTTIKYLRLKYEKAVTVPRELEIEGERERTMKVIPVELYKGERLDWEYYEREVEKMFVEILK